MAKRKHTTARPEKIPIKTESTRKKRSSRKTVRKAREAEMDFEGKAAGSTRAVGAALIAAEVGGDVT